MTGELKIGSTIYRYMRENENRLGWDTEGNRSVPMPLWQEAKIIGESKTHWHVGVSWAPFKVNKKTLYEAGKGGYSGSQWCTADGTNREWRGKHQRKIALAIEHGAVSVEQLKQIARIINYITEE